MTEGLGLEPFAGDALRRGAKSASAFRTISEVAGDLNVPQHVLRFWETRFSQIRPLKRAGGRRYYRPEDVDLLRRIRDLLYRHGYTIRGAQRLLREAARGGAFRPEARDASADAGIAAEQPPAAPIMADGFAPAMPPESPPGPERRADPSPRPSPGRAAMASSEGEPAVRRADHIEEVIVELTALRDLLRARRRR